MSLPLPRRRRSLPGCWAVAGLVLALGRPPAVHAAPCCGLSWQFEADTAPPFSLSELEQAVRIRRPPGADDSDAVAVRWAYPGVIEARTRDRRRVVELGPTRGPEAARLVAVAVLDVLRPPVAPEADAQLPAAKSDDASATSLAARAQPAAPGLAPRRSLRLALSAALNRGVTSAGFALEPTGSAALALVALDVGQLGLSFELGYGQGRGRVANQNFVVHMIPLRLCAFAARGGYAVNAGALVRPYFTSGWGGGRGTLAGGTLGAEARLPAEGPLAAVLALGVDLPANAVDFRVGDVSLLDTGRVVPWLRLGISWRAL